MLPDEKDSRKHGLESLPESLLSTYDFKDIHMYINQG